MIRVMVDDVEFYVDTHAVTRKDYVGVNAAPTISLLIFIAMSSNRCVFCTIIT